LAISEIWNGGLDALGLGYAALAAVLLSIFFLMGEHTQQKRDTLSTMFYTMLVSSLFWLCISPWWQFDFDKLASSVNLTGNLNQTSLPFMVVVLWIGVAGSFIPMLLSYAAPSAAFLRGVLESDTVFRRLR
jgi:threonine/homoserine efflux transporter RhtA